MTKQRMVLLGLLSLALVLVSCIGIVESAAPPVSCSGYFELRFTNEAGDSEAALVGNLQLEVNEDGQASGQFSDDQGVIINVVGQANGQAISLAFDLEDDTYIFGTGTLTHPIQACQGVAGGPVAGPETIKMGQASKGHIGVLAAPLGIKVKIVAPPERWIWALGRSRPT